MFKTTPFRVATAFANAPKRLSRYALLGVLTIIANPAWAAPHSGHHHGAVGNHAPIGVMGDHLHAAGEWMFSYRFMRMQMEDNLSGSERIDPDTIVTTQANRFFGQPMQPPTLRVVPLEMQTDMHMLGAMYAPNSKITLMAMVNYIEHSMDHVTYMGGMGTTVRGMFTTETSGIGDTKIAALIGAKETHRYRLHFNIGLSIPTGNIEKRDQILTPMGQTPNPRLPYPMQLGSGSWDFEPGITIAGTQGRWDWGSQLKGIVRLETNDEDYRLGDKLTVTSWGSYRFAAAISGSLRLSYSDQKDIHGIDPAIIAPVQTADPDNHGGQRWDLGIGVNLIGSEGAQRGHRVAIEYETTLDQKANGIQLEMKDMLTIGYQYSL